MVNTYMLVLIHTWLNILGLHDIMLVLDISMSGPYGFSPMLKD